MPDSVNYPRGGASAQAAADENRKYAEQIAESKRRIQAADMGAADSADLYRAALQRELLAEREVADVTGQAASAVTGAATARRGAASAAAANTVALQREAVATREAAAAMGEYSVAASKSGRSFGVMRNGEQVAGGFRTADRAAAQAASLRASEAASLGLAGGGGVPPPPRPPAPPGGAGGEEGNVGRLSGAMNQQVAVEERLAGSERSLFELRSQSGAQMAALSTDTRRYGALTSEFFEAMARGEVTVKEIGYQMGVTAAKFGGWTAAAGAIFGVIAALHEVKQGAVDAQSSVETLSRFLPNLNRGQATQGLIDTSSQFVAPIKEVGEAQAAFARVVKDQGDSLTAARTSILATKLDNISLADSYRYLIALVQEFKFPASELPSLFDQISGAQRNMGARVSEILPALAKASGAIRSAASDGEDSRKVYSQLLAEMSTAQIVTGQSGNLIGTAFARGAANFYNSTSTLRGVGKSPIEIEKSLGIDTTLGFTDRLHQAIVKGATLTPHEQQQLSQAFFGPLRGGLLTGLFRAEAQLQRAEAVTGPGYTAGSTMEEWRRQASRADVQISALKVHMQDVGAQIQKSGALAPFGALIYGGNQSLIVLEHIFKGFGRMSSGARETAEAVGALLIVMRGLSSFAGGQLLSKTPFLRFFDNPQARQQQLLTSGLSQGVTGAREAAVTSATQAQRAGLIAERTDAEVVAQRQRLAALANTEANQEAITAGTARLAELEAQAAAQTALAGAAQQKSIAAQEVYRAREAEIAKVNAMSAPQAAAYGASQGLWVRPHFGAPTSDPLAQMRAGGMAAEAAQIAALTKGTAVDASEIGLWTAAKARLTEVVLVERDAAIGCLTAEEAQAAAMEAAVLAEEELAMSVPLTTAAMNTLRTAGQALMSNLGLLTVAFMGGLLVYDQISSISKENADAAKAQADAIHLVTTNQTEMDKQMHALYDAQKRLKDDKLTSDIPGVAAAENWVLGLVGAGPPKGKTPAQQATADATAKELFANSPQGQFESSYNYLAQQFAKESMGWAKTIEGRHKIWEQSLAFKARIAELAQTLAPGDPAMQSRLEQAFANTLQTAYANAMAAAKPTKISGKDPFAQFSTQSLDNNIKNLQALADQVKVYGPTNGKLQQMAYLYEYIVSSQSGATDSKTLQKVVAAESAFVEAVTKDVQDKIDQADAITVPSKKAGGAAARAAALHQRSAILRAASAELKLQEANLERAFEVAALESKIAVDALAVAMQRLNGVDNWIKNINSTIGSIAGIAGGKATPLAPSPEFAGPSVADAAKQAQKRANDAKKRMDAANRAKKQADTAFQKLANQIANDQQTYANQLASTNAAGASADPFEIARLQGELAKARAFNDPIAQALSDERFAQVELAGAKNQKEKLRAQIDLQNAQNAYDQAVEDVAQARFDYLKSLTTDPVKQAGIDVQAAAQQVQWDASHGGPNTAKGLRDRAAFNTAKQNLTNVSIQDRESTIDFRLQLQQISTQTAIQEYEGLLHVHGITKQLRQQVLERIHELQTAGQSDFGALDLGSIRLPTPYEIRRSVMQLRDQATTVVQQNTAEIHVYDSRDADRVGVQLEGIMGGTGKSLARAAGTRG